MTMMMFPLFNVWNPWTPPYWNNSSQPHFDKKPCVCVFGRLPRPGFCTAAALCIYTAAAACWCYTGSLRGRRGARLVRWLSVT